MKLLQAMQIVNQMRKEPNGGSVFLACGCTPLHLPTYLAALLAQRQTGRFDFVTGVYGDLIGNVRRMRDADHLYRFVIVEWSDLDPRLGYRIVHGWRTDKIADIVRTARERGEALKRALIESADDGPLCILLPTLPLPPLFPPATPRASSDQFQLQSDLTAWAAELAAYPQLRFVDASVIDRLSPLSQRHHPRDDFAHGYPYQLEHTYQICRQLVQLAQPIAPKRGIITDLDNTVWRGVLGDDGVDGISWHLEHHSFAHALYQETLASLADLGVLLAVASKNDLRMVRQAIERTDMVLSPQQLFPILAHWGPKSQSVREILKVWNIGPDTVVFIDDSPMELAEVQAAFPMMECLSFPTHDDTSVVELLRYLRAQFGKTATSYEDKIRLESLRAGAIHISDQAADADDFLRQLDATLSIVVQQPDDRSFELINKTNQFNLNGLRWSDAEWKSRISDPQRFLIGVCYTDKFGPLGKIAVLAGTSEPDWIVDTWVLSCRAFSRRIEFQILLWLFDRYGHDCLRLQYAATPRNGPLQEFLRVFSTPLADGMLRLSRDDVVRACPPCFGKVTLDERD